MIRLTSKWVLRDGVKPELLDKLSAAAKAVEDHEPGTLMYLIHVPPLVPVLPSGLPVAPPPCPASERAPQYIMFAEAYADASAFKDHLNGPIFTQFRNATLKYFEQDPKREGWPLSQTDFLNFHAGFIRPGI